MNSFRDTMHHLPPGMVRAGYFLRHFGEMMLAMMAGMAAGAVACGLYCITMVAAMLAAMLFRLDLYTMGHAGH